jgi:hypothetical protein
VQAEKVALGQMNQRIEGLTGAASLPLEPGGSLDVRGRQSSNRQIIKTKIASGSRIIGLVFFTWQTPPSRAI